MFSSPNAAAGGGFAGLFVQMAPLIAIFAIFYMLLIRPQQKRMKEQRASIDAVKKGDEVVTSGGHIGKVTKVTDDEVEVEFAVGHRHRVVKTMLHEVRLPGSGKPAND
jgi:preprotein translocase subunit YajC